MKRELRDENYFSLGENLGLLNTFDSLLTVIIVASLLLGFWNASSSLGSVSDIVRQAIDQPQTFGVGMAMFYLGLDTWTPAIPESFLAEHGLAWLTWFYPFTGGFIPHFSIWSALVGILVATIATLMARHFWHLSFWKCLLVWPLSFLAGYYLWTLIAWKLMFMGGTGMGLTEQQVYEIWHGSVSATEN